VKKLGSVAKHLSAAFQLNLLDSALQSEVGAPAVLCVTLLVTWNRRTDGDHLCGQLESRESEVDLRAYDLLVCQRSFNQIYCQCVERLTLLLPFEDNQCFFWILPDVQAHHWSGIIRISL
jgi:hypothetical protein